jgi:hypothetical protein
VADMWHACWRLQAHERIMQATTAEPIAAALRELDAALLPSLAATPAAYQLRAHALLRLNRCISCCSSKTIEIN